MTWTCPRCKKIFRNTDQWHSCARLTVDDHLKGKPTEIAAIVTRLIEEVKSFGPVDINPVKSSIQVKVGATFMSIRVKKNHVELEFQLGRSVDEFPVYRIEPISKNRSLHFMKLDSPLEVDAQLINWLRESYELVK